MSDYYKVTSNPYTGKETCITEEELEVMKGYYLYNIDDIILDEYNFHKNVDTLDGIDVDKYIIKRRYKNLEFDIDYYSLYADSETYRGIQIDRILYD